MPKLLKYATSTVIIPRDIEIYINFVNRFYNYLKKEERSFQMIYVSSDKYVCHHAVLPNVILNWL